MATDEGITIGVDFGEPSPKVTEVMLRRMAEKRIYDNTKSPLGKELQEIREDIAKKTQLPEELLFGRDTRKQKADEEARRILQDIAGSSSNDLHELAEKIIFGNEGKAKNQKLFATATIGFGKNGLFSQRYGCSAFDELAELNLAGRPVFMPSRRNSKPNYGIYFTTIEDVKRHFQICDNIETMKMIYRYRKGNIESRVEVDAFDRLQKQMTAEDIFRELAKGYDKAVIEEVFKMTQFDFNEKIAMLDRIGCRVEIHSEFGFRQYVNVSVPFDLFRYLKITPTETSTPANNPIPPIKDIKIQNDKVVIVYFEDGSFTKSICKDDETFNVYTGVMVCLFKRMLGKDDGQKKFTRLMEKAMGFFGKKYEARKKALEEKMARIEAEKVKQNRNLRRKNKKREEQISIFAEALKRDRQAADTEKFMADARKRAEASNEGI